MPEVRVQLSVTGQPRCRRSDLRVLLRPEFAERLVSGIGSAPHAIEELHRPTAVEDDQIGADDRARPIALDQRTETVTDAVDAAGELVEPSRRGTRHLEH